MGCSLMLYDFIIVGAGMFGATFARVATDAGRKCLVLDKRPHIGGNCYSEAHDGIQVHQYGPHIFHCNDEGIWAFVNRFARFNRFRNSPIALHRGKAYSLPFSMYTFNQMWGVVTPDEARARVESQKLRLDRPPRNLEEQALTLVGRDIYETLIRDYTRKQWQRDPRNLPASIIRRLPVRFSWNNDYYDDAHQGIPIGGYTAMFERMLTGIEVRTGVDYLPEREHFAPMARTVVFTGRIDEYFGFCVGELEYRTLTFETETLNCQDFQGNAVVNYADPDVPWTRIIEHKHFELGNRSDRTIITREIPIVWSAESIPYYPVGDAGNVALCKQYEALAANERNVLFGGRLGEFRYYDMHQAIGAAMALARRLVLG